MRRLLFILAFSITAHAATWTDAGGNFTGLYKKQRSSSGQVGYFELTQTQLDTIIKNNNWCGNTPVTPVTPTCVAPQVLDTTTNKCVTPNVTPTPIPTPTPTPTPTPVTSIWSIAPPDLAVGCAEMNKTCTIPAGMTATVFMGAGDTSYIMKKGLTGQVTCDKDAFGYPNKDTYVRCFYLDEKYTVANLTQAGVMQMPTYDPAKIPAPSVGVSTLQIRPAAIPDSRDPITAGGEFRIGCDFAKMLPDDPIVFPDVQGASHLHTFFGNTGTTAYSTPDTLRTSGNGTCAGGIANRSAYWIPALINTTTGAPQRPVDTVTYYKSNYGKDATYMQPVPKGLRMISGNAKPLSVADSTAYMYCQDRTKVNQAPDYGIIWQGNHLQSCGGPNQDLRISVTFPSCWDGKNLDSPDHKSHMAKYCKDECEDASGNIVNTANGCPASHPIAIPLITINADYRGLDPNAKYRLASDNYSTAMDGGYSSHGDFMNGWDETIMKRIIDNCMHKHMNCGGPNLGDGEELFGFFND